MTDEQKHKFDALVALASFRTDLRKVRVEREWKITLGIWALLAASIALPNETLSREPPWLIVVILAVFVLMHLWWIASNWRRNEQDILLAHRYIVAARTLVDVLDPPEPAPGELARRFFLKPQALLQSVATLVIATTVGALLLFRANQCV